MTDLFAYVGSYTKEKNASLSRNACSTGIQVFRISSDGLSWDKLQDVPLLNPCVISFGKNRSKLYSLSADSNVITVFSVDPDSGLLSEVQCYPVEGAQSLSVFSISNSGDRLIAADFSGYLYVIALSPEGRCESVTCRIQPPGTVGPLRKTWQPCSRPHHVVFSPDDRFVYIPDKGYDLLHTYCLSPAPESKLTLYHQVYLPRAGCPRHVVLSPDGNSLFCNLEFRSCAIACDLADGRPEPFQIVSTLPETHVDPYSKSSEIVIHPTGKWLYVSNRGHDSIAVYDFLPNGLMHPVQWISCGGHIPRYFTLDPSGKVLLCCNQFSNSITIFKINTHTGSLEQVGQPIFAECPVWLLLSGKYPTINTTSHITGIT